MPPSFGFQKENKAQMQKLQSGQMAMDESQEFMGRYIIHCIQRATPGVDVSTLENDLDAVEIAKASVVIGQETQKQIAQAYGVDSLGGATAGAV